MTGRTIIHFIDSLGTGGAETLLMNYINKLPAYKHIIVILTGPNNFIDITRKFEFYQLNLEAKRNFFKIIVKLRKIIKSQKVDILHSHSYWTNIISRLAATKTVKVINHYHFADYDTAFEKKSVIRMVFIDKILKHRNLVRIAVSKYVERILKENFRDSKIMCIPNFVNCNFENIDSKSIEPDSCYLKIIAVGNLKWEKGYDMVVEVFKELKEYNIILDVYGGGEKLNEYRQKVREAELVNLTFKGNCKNVREIYKDYNIYCSTSISETFGMALIEAACAGLPILVSDIPAFKEIAPEGTVFFRNNNSKDFIEKLKNIYYNGLVVYNNKYLNKIEEYSEKNFLKAIEKIYMIDC